MEDFKKFCDESTFGTAEDRKQLHDLICQELIQVENFYDMYRWGQIDEQEL
jgi:hypothetical protein